MDPMGTGIIKEEIITYFSLARVAFLSSFKVQVFGGSGGHTWMSQEVSKRLVDGL